MSKKELLSAEGRRRFSVDDLFENGQAGDWYVDEEQGDIWIMHPHLDSYGEIELDPMRWPYRTPLLNGAIWRYNNNPDKPTMKPSLNWVNTWHGWLTDGKLTHV